MTMLEKAGIDSVTRLRELGAVRAYRQVQLSGARPSLNLLWALEGALTDQPWQQIAQAHRLSLLLELENASQNSTASGVHRPAGQRRAVKS